MLYTVLSTTKDPSAVVCIGKSTVAIVVTKYTFSFITGLFFHDFHKEDCKKKLGFFSFYFFSWEKKI